MMKKIKHFLNRFYVYRYIAYRIHKYNVLKNPKNEAQRAYSIVFNKKIDWDNPQDLIEKILWLQLNSDTTLWSKYADKYLVRDYVKECGYEENLPVLYGKWDDVESIDFSKLPKQYVLKTNHACGTVLFINNNEQLNLKKTKRMLKRWLSIPYGYSGAQLHYLKIKPCIIAEEFLTNNERDLSVSPKSLIDYKLYCFNGIPEFIFTTFNRTSDGVDVSLFDVNWKEYPEHFVSSSFYKLNKGKIQKPKCLNKMLEIGKKLSMPFHQVRVDFYVINDKPVIGELTFATGYGFFTYDLYNYLGSKIDLNNKARV